MQNLSLKNKCQKIGLVLSIIAVPIIIYFYFLKWKTVVIYGDDLSIYTNYIGLNSFYEKMNFPLSFGKYRPIHGLSMSFLIETFQKNLEAYYFFNIAMQTLITFSFALVVNLFLKSPTYSLFISLTIGLSRFSFFNITQLLNGGALEGLAMTLFLLTLFFILRVLVNNDYTSLQKQNGIILSVIFANLTLYTHERYIVVFPFIILLILFFPSLKTLALKQRLTLIITALLSIVLNIVIKKYVYSIPFFVGTAGTNISFSFSTTFQFLIEAILSIVQINTGPAYLVGIPFSSLSITNQILAISVCASTLIILTLHISNIWQVFNLKQRNNYLILYISKIWKGRQSNYYSNLLISVSLLVLFIFLLTSSIITIRLEQRWLQAPLSIFILMIVVAISSLQFKISSAKNILFSIFIILFIWNDYNYLSKGANYIYFISAEKSVLAFKQAIDSGTIRATTSNLYIWEKQRDANTENAIKWYLIDGAFFDFYQNKSKKVIFIDPTDTELNINSDSDQIIFIDSIGKINLR